MTDDLLQHIIEVTAAREIVKTEVIQELWSGYGHIYRCQLAGAKIQSVVVKQVKLPQEAAHPRGWNTDISHQRKLKSYHVEMAWYSGLAGSCDDHCRVPKTYSVSNGGDNMLIIMEDLNFAGFPQRIASPDMDEINACLLWLANFHARFMAVRSEGLWEVGTYWHLATRPDELEAMKDQELKAAAQRIDERLNQAQYQTIVHGDAKLDNFCFSENGKQVAAVDFQYIGHGCGMKDVAYLLSSCLHEEELNHCESMLLDYYFKALKEALDQHHQTSDFEEIRQEWSHLYKYAWADFYRFLDGWSPGHWKINTYSESIKNQVLNELSSKL
ncbi:MAG: phosphotransferase [Reichenbachiella sp.]|uniref:phosphotransferase n=1 Tax=Reichenbachiella sp. TaxID=2184521 RepID=UPI0032634784